MYETTKIENIISPMIFSPKSSLTSLESLLFFVWILVRKFQKRNLWIFYHCRNSKSRSFYLLISLLSELPLPMIVTLLQDSVFFYFFCWLTCRTWIVGFDNFLLGLYAYFMSVLIHGHYSLLKQTIVFQVWNKNGFSERQVFLRCMFSTFVCAKTEYHISLFT